MKFWKGKFRALWLSFGPAKGEASSDRRWWFVRLLRNGATMIALALAMGVSFSHLAYNTHKEAEPTSWRTFTTEFEPPDPVVLKMEVSRVSVRTLRPESDLPATGAYVLLLQAHHITSKAVSQSPDGLPRFLLRASSTQRPDEMTQSGVIAAESHGGPVRSPPPTKPST